MSFPSGQDSGDFRSEFSRGSSFFVSPCCIWEGNLEHGSWRWPEKSQIHLCLGFLPPPSASSRNRPLFSLPNQAAPSVVHTQNLPPLDLSIIFFVEHVFLSFQSQLKCPHLLEASAPTPTPSPPHPQTLRVTCGIWLVRLFLSPQSFCCSPKKMKTER